MSVISVTLLLLLFVMLFMLLFMLGYMLFLLSFTLLYVYRYIPSIIFYILFFFLLTLFSSSLFTPSVFICCNVSIVYHFFPFSPSIEILLISFPLSLMPLSFLDYSLSLFFCVPYHFVFSFLLSPFLCLVRTHIPGNIRASHTSTARRYLSRHTTNASFFVLAVLRN